MGLTERHWFEEEDALNERQLEDEVEYGEKRYQAGYKKGYADALASRPQEAVEPEIYLICADKYKVYRCSGCKTALSYEYKYCPGCGRKVKWNEY